MTTQEAARRPGKSNKTIRRRIEAGKLKSKLLDGMYEIDEQDVISIQMSI